MASGNSSGLGSSLFRGALHGNSNNSSGSSSGGSSGSNNTQHHHSIHHHHHHHHHHHTTTTAHHLQQGTVSGNPHLHHSQPPPPPPQPAQSQPSVGQVWFTPTDVSCGRGSTTSPDHMSTLMAKLWFDHNVESSLSALKKEEHEKRLRDLRKELDYIADTDWKYSPVEKYIGKH